MQQTQILQICNFENFNNPILKKKKNYIYKSLINFKLNKSPSFSFVLKGPKMS